MKGRYLYWGLLSLMAVSCTMSEFSSPEESDFVPAGKNAYYALIDDQPKDVETKTYADKDLRVLWKHDDRVTIFEDITDAKELFFAGEDGRTGGGFDFVEGSNTGHAYYGGSGLGGMKYAIYPHSTETLIARVNNKILISYILPGIQKYKENSFGEGANLMVAETELNSNILRFKNVGGYLSFYLYGSNISVSSVTLKSNGGEPLSGLSTITMVDGVPQITMSQDNSSDEVRIVCKDAVVLGETADDATEFRFVLPPMTFSDAGFTLSVATSDGGLFTKEGRVSFEVKRNIVLSAAPLLVVDPEYSGSSITIREISSNAGGYGVEGKLGAKYTNKATFNPETERFTITLPTVTDFSEQIFNFTLGQSGDVLLFDGEEVVSGVTPIDVSSPATLTVRRGEFEKMFTLEAKNTGLPVVRITTEGFTLEQLEKYMNSLSNTDGPDNTGIDYRKWLPDDDGKVFLPDNDGRVSTTSVDGSVTIRIEKANGEPGMGDLYEVATQIKGRGNYTWKWDKKPYALKLGKKNISVLGMPAHKRWVLLANWRDHTLLRNDAAFWLSEQSGLPYSVRGRFVELEINGEHRGNYYLCEQIKPDSERVPITEMDKGAGFGDLTGGYLMEIDSYWDERNKFQSEYFGLKYMFKEPDEDTTDPETNPAYAQGYTWMRNRINELEKSLKTKSEVESGKYEDYLDVDSAIKFVLLNEVTGNRDFFQNVHTQDHDVYGPHSTYLYKDKKKKDENGELVESKIFMGPIWDFDYKTFVPATDYDYRKYSWRGFDAPGYYYYFLCHNGDFVQRVKDLWTEMSAKFTAGFNAYIETKYREIVDSQGFDAILWPYKNGQANRNDNNDYAGYTFREAIDRMESSFSTKVTWMNLQILGNGTNQYQGLKTTNPKDSEWAFQ